jgi:hypothetical protein
MESKVENLLHPEVKYGFTANIFMKPTIQTIFL